MTPKSFTFPCNVLSLFPFIYLFSSQHYEMGPGKIRLVLLVHLPKAGD